LAILGTNRKSAVQRHFIEARGWAMTHKTHIIRDMPFRTVFQVSFFGGMIFAVAVGCCCWLKLWSRFWYAIHPSTGADMIDPMDIEVEEEPEERYE
jgi:hypothetical protein